MRAFGPLGLNRLLARRAEHIRKGLILRDLAFEGAKRAGLRAGTAERKAGASSRTPNVVIYVGKYSIN